MGQVALTLRVTPESPEVDLQKLKENISSIEGVKQINEKPIGFGLVALEVLLVFDDKKGSPDFEEKVRSIEGVGSVETGDITLI